jgi:hypothetical protein
VSNFPPRSVKSRGHTEPVQKVGQASFRATPKVRVNAEETETWRIITPVPCPSQAERYGVRTARGIEGGLKGVAVHEAARAVARKRDNRDSEARETQLLNII